MANLKRTIASKAYIPNGGLNADNNSLALRNNEFTDVLNLRVFDNRVEQREGSCIFTDQTPSGDPIIHDHTFRDSDQKKVKFVFTKNRIFRRIDTTNALVDAIAAPLAADVTFWSTTGFTDEFGGLGTTVIAAGSSPPGPTAQETDGPIRVLLALDNVTLMFSALQQLSEFIQAVDEVIDTGDGATATFSGSLANTLVKPNTLQIATFDTGGSPLVVTDDGAGALVGDIAAGTNTIDYDTGAYDVTFSADVESATNILADYNFCVEINKFPRFVRNFHQRVVGSNVFDADNAEYNPWQVIWSEVGDAIRYDRVTGFRNLTDNDRSSIVGMEYLQRVLVIGREDSIGNFQFAGGTDIFEYKTTLQEGLYEGRTMATWRNFVFFKGKDDIYRYDGFQAIKVADQRMQRRIFDSTSTDDIKLTRNFAHIYPKFDEYWLWTTLPDEDFPSQVFVYRIKQDAWTYFRFRETAAVGTYNTISGVTIDELVGTIDDQNWTLNGGGLEGTPEALVLYDLQEERGYIVEQKLSADYVEDGVTSTPIDWLFTSRDFVQVDLPRIDRINQLDYEARGTLGNISYSLDFGLTFRREKSETFPTNFQRQRYWIDRNADHIRFKFEKSDFSQVFSLRWLQVLGVVREKY